MDTVMDPVINLWPDQSVEAVCDFFSAVYFYCSDLYDLEWFNEKGLFVVRHDRQSAGDKFYIYLLCPDTEATSKGGMWMKYQRD